MILVNEAVQPIRIPTRIDDPPHVLIWAVDEVAPMLIGLSFGMMIGEALICFLIGYLFTRFYKRFRDNHPDGYFLHLIYWWGLMPASKARSMKNPFIRRYLP